MDGQPQNVESLQEQISVAERKLDKLRSQLAQVEKSSSQANTDSDYNQDAHPGGSDQMRPRAGLSTAAGVGRYLLRTTAVISV